MCIIIPPFCCSKAFNLSLVAVKSNMKIGRGVLSFKDTENTSVVHRVGADDIAELENHLHRICTLVATNLHPYLTLWNYPIVPCQTVGSVLLNSIVFSCIAFLCIPVIFLQQLKDFGSKVWHIHQG